MSAARERRRWIRLWIPALAGMTELRAAKHTTSKGNPPGYSVTR